jgi:hypothetical protein
MSSFNFWLFLAKFLSVFAGENFTISKFNKLANKKVSDDQT